jgi:hypothetical protein
MTRSAQDCAPVLQAIAGHDTAYSVDAPVPDYRQGLREDLVGVRVWHPDRRPVSGCPPRGSVGGPPGGRGPGGAGGARGPFIPPSSGRPTPSRRAILRRRPRRASAPPEKTGPRTWIRPSDDARKPASSCRARCNVHAQRLRRTFAQQINKIFLRVDALATPTAPSVAPPLLVNRTVAGVEQTDIRRTLTQFARPFNLTGQPALAVPVWLLPPRACRSPCRSSVAPSKRRWCCESVTPISGRRTDISGDRPVATWMSLDPDQRPIPLMLA